MSRHFFQARAGFLKANRDRFIDWGEGDNYRITGAGIEEFHDLFVLVSTYYGRLGWISRKRPIWYRQKQMSHDAVERMFGWTPYGKLFSKFGSLQD